MKIKNHQGVPYLVMIAPTGVGKSLMYMAGLRMRGERAIVLTSTKALQAQLKRDFPNVAVLKGRNNYPCLVAPTTAEEGPCRWDIECPVKPQCPYYLALEEAKVADVVVTNYACYLTGVLDPAPIIVADEGHTIPEHLANYYTAELPQEALFRELGWIVNAVPQGVAQALSEVEERVKQAIAASHWDVVKRLCRLAEALRQVLRVMQYKPLEEQEGGVIKLYAVGPADPLVKGCRVLVATSATITPLTLNLIGIEERAMETVEFPSIIPVANRLITVLDGVKVDRTTTEWEDRLWAAEISKIIRRHLDVKGIVHTGNYARAKRFLELARISEVPMFTHHRRNLEEVVQRFRASRRGWIVSPALTTGYDFPGDQVRCQIVAKLPFPDVTDPRTRLMSEANPLYAYHQTWTNLIQACGRGVRGETDWCRTYIIDRHFHWFNRRYGHLAPRWFREALRRR